MKWIRVTPLSSSSPSWSVFLLSCSIITHEPTSMTLHVPFLKFSTVLLVNPSPVFVKAYICLDSWLIFISIFLDILGLVSTHFLMILIYLVKAILDDLNKILQSFFQLWLPYLKVVNLLVLLHSLGTTLVLIVSPIKIKMILPSWIVGIGIGVVLLKIFKLCVFSYPFQRTPFVIMPSFTKVTLKWLYLAHISFI